MTPAWMPPEIPISAGAMLFDSAGRLLILKPTYKKGWTIPGGAMEADGETPWEGCQREVLEETGLTVTSARLAVVDSRPAKPREKLGVRFLFDCGTLSDEQIASIRLQASEISQYKFVDRDGAEKLLRKAVRHRVLAGWGQEHCLYLEDGQPLDAVR